MHSDFCGWVPWVSIWEWANGNGPHMERSVGRKLREAALRAAQGRSSRGGTGAAWPRLIWMYRAEEMLPWGPSHQAAHGCSGGHTACL